MSEADRTTARVEEADECTTDVPRPLPVVEVHRPSAKRGAKDAREELDGERCVFCDVLVGEDEQEILTDYFGTLSTFSICKAHLEHPASWRQATEWNPDRVRYCDGCGDLTTTAHDGECFDCRRAEMLAKRGRA